MPSTDKHLGQAEQLTQADHLKVLKIQRMRKAKNEADMAQLKAPLPPERRRDTIG